MKCPFCIKVCSKCGKILVAYSGNFAKEKRGKYGLRYDCKICKNEQNKQYREDNKEKIAEQKKQYYEENRERISERNKQYREDNKDYYRDYYKQYREDNKDYYRDYYKQYYASEQGQVVQFNAHNKRRQREEEQGRGITVEQWKEMFDFFGWRCAYSGEYLGGDMEGRTIDHIIPLNNGGLNEPWNCVPMYSNYNRRKHTSDMLDWYIQQAFFSEERLNKIYEWIEYAYNKWGKND